MLQLKDIAAAMDVHPRTAKRWWKKLDAECRRLRLPRVKPDVIGHGPHRWEPATAARLIKLWRLHYESRGTSPQIARAKYAGDLSDARQLVLTSILDDKFTPRKRILTGAMEKTDTRAKARGDAKTQPALAKKTSQGRAATL